MLKRIFYGAAIALAGSIGLALAAAGPTTVINLWNPGGLHGVAPGLAAQDGSGNIAPGLSVYDKSGNPNDATHPVYTAPASNLADPCGDPSIAKSSAVINIGAAATTKVVDVSTGKAIYVCGLHLSLAGTTPSITWKYGTHVTNDCDTGATALSGTILPTSGSMLTYGAGAATLMSTPASQQLCGTTVGTGSSAQGVLTYVQQ